MNLTTFIEMAEQVPVFTSTMEEIEIMKELVKSTNYTLDYAKLNGDIYVVEIKK